MTNQMKLRMVMLGLYFRQTSTQKAVPVQVPHNFGRLGSAAVLVFKATSDRKNDFA